MAETLPRCADLTREMLTGRRYKLRCQTLGLTDLADGKRKCVMVPDGAVVRVLSGPLVPEDRMVDVFYGGQCLTMFVADLRDRGEEILDDADAA